MDQVKTIINIERTSQYVNSIRTIKIYINGEKIGHIKDGETKEYITDSKEINIYAKIDWCKTKTLSFNFISDGNIYLELGSRHKNLVRFMDKLRLLTSIFKRNDFIYLKEI